MFDPTLPQEGTPLDAVQMRAQLNGLKALIDSLLTVTAAQVDGVNTLPAGSAAGVTVTVTGNTLHFSFEIPEGPQGEPGAQGEVSQSALDAAVMVTSANSNAVSTLGLSPGDPDVQAVAYKLDELIMALRR